ncbi:hypothetical protein HPB50_001478 [Hyalomma asiaticum]|uniref:Uncharacterized protein n=1 Tax=Hyalomma asiaticum TaxID=266040 RepID=A0ACB7TAA1_HYAAI|nr:hypothetical protein HPB50_001478 [Hyalomma asiaticum]
MMGVVDVEGKDISPKEIRNDKGWLEVRSKHKKNTTPVEETNPAAQEAATLNKEETYRRRAARNLRRLGMASKKPNLPVDDIKVIVRPKDGFSTATHRAARIDDGIRNAAGLRQEETRGDIFQGEARGRPSSRSRSRARSRSRHTEPQSTPGARENTRPRSRSRSIARTGPTTMRAPGNGDTNGRPKASQVSWAETASGARARVGTATIDREGGNEILMQIQKRLEQLENDNARYMHVIKELREENAKLKEEVARKDVIVQYAESKEEVQVGEETVSIPAKRRAIEVDPAQAESITHKSEDKIRKRQDRLEAQVEEDIKTLRKEMEEGKNTRKNEMEGMLSQVTNALQQITSTVQQIQQQLTALQMRVENVERMLPASNCGPLKPTGKSYNRPAETEAKDNTGKH